MKIKLQNKMKRFQQGKVSGALKVDTFMYLLNGKEYKHEYKTLEIYYCWQQASLLLTRKSA